MRQFTPRCAWQSRAVRRPLQAQPHDKTTRGHLPAARATILLDVARKTAARVVALSKDGSDPQRSLIRASRKDRGERRAVLPAPSWPADHRSPDVRTVFRQCAPSRQPAIASGVYKPERSRPGDRSRPPRRSRHAGDHAERRRQERSERGGRGARRRPPPFRRVREDRTSASRRWRSASASRRAHLQRALAASGTSRSAYITEL